MLEYVEAIRKIGEYYAIPICDFYSESNLSPLFWDDKKKYTKDGCHPNKAGGKRLAKLLERTIERYGYN